MSFVRFYTVLLTLIGITMTVLLAVVCLLYLIYLDATPKMREEWPTLLAATGLFALLALCAAAAWYALRRNAAWRWPAQGVLVAYTVATALVLKNFLLG